MPLPHHIPSLTQIMKMIREKIPATLPMTTENIKKYGNLNNGPSAEENNNGKNN